MEFGAKNIEIRNKIYRIQIWDTAGQENFRSIMKAYYKNSVCAIIVYNIKNRISLIIYKIGLKIVKIKVLRQLLWF